MTHSLDPIDLPIRLQCLRIPVSWRIETGKTTKFFLPEGHGSEKATSYDPWEMRGKFFRLKRGDNEGAISLLNEVGFFTAATIESAQFLLRMDPQHDLDWNRDYFHAEGLDGRHLVSGLVGAFLVDAFWSERGIMESLLRKDAGTVSEWITVNWDFQVRLAAEFGRFGPSAVITTTAFLDSVAASIRIDHLRHAKIKTCKRPDCGITYAAVGPRKRKYCCWDCGHLMSVRKSRRKK